MSMSSEPVRLEDIAAALSLSINTVSRALNNKPGVNEDTRQRIKIMAKNLGYKPNAMARSLRGHSMNIVGVIIDDNTNPYLSEVLKGIESKAYQLGYYLLFFNSNFDVQRELNAIDVLMQIRAKGIIMHPTQITDKLSRIINQSLVPVVLFGSRRGELNADSVRSDNITGMRDILTYLIKRGYQRIAFLNLAKGMDVSEMRREGVRKTLMEHGLPSETITEYNISFEEGAYGITRFLMTSINRPDCILCGCDLFAAQAMEMIYDLGYEVPHDIALAGYDNISLSKNFRVPLTTVSQPKAAIGEICMDLLDQRIRGEGPDEYVDNVLKPTLVVRTSA